MDTQLLAEGVRIMTVGIVGVFANLLLIMLMISIMGRVFGKPKKKTN